VGQLPFAANSVDLVLMSQVAHHLAPSAVIDLVRAATRIARRGVILADLSRSRLAAVGFAVAARALRFDRATRHDGVTSVRRGYLVPELRALLSASGVSARIHTRPPCRLVATWRPAPGA
jgi:hypothetical protein